MPNINEFKLTAAEEAALAAARLATIVQNKYTKSPYYNEANGRAFERALRAHIKNGKKGGVWRAHAGGDTYTTLRSKLYCGKAWLADHTDDPVLVDLLPRIRLKSDKSAGTMKMVELDGSAGVYKSVDGFVAYTSDQESNIAELKEKFLTWAENAADGDLFDVANLALTEDEIGWFNEQRDELGLFGRVDHGRIMVGMAKGPAPAGPESDFEGGI